MESLDKEEAVRESWAKFGIRGALGFFPFYGPMGAVDAIGLVTLIDAHWPLVPAAIFGAIGLWALLCWGQKRDGMASRKGLKDTLPEIVRVCALVWLTMPGITVGFFRLGMLMPNSEVRLSDVYSSVPLAVGGATAISILLAIMGISLHAKRKGERPTSV